MRETARNSFGLPARLNSREKQNLKVALRANEIKLLPRLSVVSTKPGHQS
jgi:hypothetical protein